MAQFFPNMATVWEPIASHHFMLSTTASKSGSAYDDGELGHGHNVLARKVN